MVKSNLAIIIIGCLWISGAGVLAEALQVQQITDNSFDDSDLCLDYGVMVWTGYDGNDNEIYLFNGQFVDQLTNNTVDDHSPQIKDFYAVWIRMMNSKGLVCFWDGSVTTTLTTTATDARNPRTDSGQAVWAGHDGNDLEIYFFDGAVVNQLTDNAVDDLEPDLENGVVTWAQAGTAGWYDIYLWDGSATTKITDGMMGRSPRIKDQLIVWHGFPQGSTANEVYLWDGNLIENLSNNMWNDMNPEISNGAVTWMGGDHVGWQVWLWANGSKVKLTEGSSYSNVDPDIDGGRVVWSGQTAAGYDWDVFYYDGEQTINVSNKPGWDEKPRIKGDWIAWQGYDGNDKEIYLARRVEQLLNVWHIPGNAEPLSVTMRNPLAPLEGDTSIYIYVGGYPLGAIYGGTLYYKEAAQPDWLSTPLSWDSNNGANEYWRANLTNGYRAGELIYYYLKLENPSYTTTFVYGSDTASFSTAEEQHAQTNAFQFTVFPTGSPIPSPTATPYPNLMNLWHIPNNDEPPGATMRNPRYPITTDERIYFYLGGFPQGTLYEATLYYRKNDVPAWNTTTLVWDSNQWPNEYWFTSVENFLQPGDTLKYFFLGCNPSMTDTYVYGSDNTTNTTANRDFAASFPYTYIIPTSTPTPTPGAATMTPTPNALPNVWHIPENEEPASVTMRNPVTVETTTENVYIYVGVYPIGGLYSASLFYRAAEAPDWLELSMYWDSNNGYNDYWMTSFENTFSGGDAVEYYLELWNSGYDYTYLYNNNSKTTVEAVAIADPYTFTVQVEASPTVAPTPEVTATPACIHDGDAVDDDSLSAGDAQRAFFITIGSYTPSYTERCAADCNGDGDVTAGDAQTIFYAAVGIGSCSDPLE